MTAANMIAHSGDFDLITLPDVPAIIDAVQSRRLGRHRMGKQRRRLCGPESRRADRRPQCGRIRPISVNVAFNAFTLPGASLADCRTVTAHPHGLAQCRRFMADHHLQPLPASSNAAACRDLEARPGGARPQHLRRILRSRTSPRRGRLCRRAHRFLALAPRDGIPCCASGHQDGRGEPRVDAASGGDADPFRIPSIIAFIPLSTGPGVLANLLDVLRDAGLNMTSFISRPIKGRDGTYSFIATLDAAPWEPNTAPHWKRSPTMATG